MNALYTTLIEIVVLDFSFTDDPEQMRLLLVLLVFAAGSLAGLVTLSHLLGYLLKKFRNNTNAAIIGFIAGSLGVVWPWKKEIYKYDDAGAILLDMNGSQVLDNYNRYFPSNVTWENGFALFFIIVGILLVVLLGKYGEKTRARE